MEDLPGMRMQLPILTGGCGLAFGAAFANAGLLLQAGTSVSHLTGDISRISIDLVRNSPEMLPEFPRVLAAAMAFAFGALVSGLLSHQPDLDFARPCGRTVSRIGALFVISHVFVEGAPVPALALAALACGIPEFPRHAISWHRPADNPSDRTVHGLREPTRYATPGIRIPFWKLAVPEILTASFVLGGLAAAPVFYGTDADPVFLAGIAYLLADVIWTVAKHVFFRDRFPGAVSREARD